MAGSKGENGIARGTRRAGVVSAAVLSLAALLILAAVQSPHGASAGNQAAKAIYNLEKNSIAMAANQRSQQQQYWQDFLKLEKESWHYDYSKMEKQNVKAYQKWYCTDLRLHGYKDFSHTCDRSAYPRDEMWEHEQLRDEILWNKANHQPHHEIKKTDEQMRYLQKRAEMRDSMIQHEKANNKTWHHYLSLEKQAWHYDYTRTEKQNLKAFQQWWYGGESHKMWFSEQYGREILWNKTVTGHGKESNNSLHSQQQQQQHPDNATIKIRMQSWFEEAYRQHKAEIAKNKCVNPWERTPNNASPSWSACLDAKNPSIHPNVEAAKVGKV
jgi:hypothetical protein